MKSFKLLFAAAALLLNAGLRAQGNQLPPVNQGQLPNRGCGTGILPQQFETWVKSITPVPGKFSQNQIHSVFNIPVIVHVIHNNESVNSVTATTGGNLNAAQIIDQINILNRDFNGNNADTSLIPSVFKPALGKFQFNFCLAVVNPTGGVLAEPGIERINRVAKGWTAPPYGMNYISTVIKPASIWDPTRYLNMWVCGISGGILGFATFPNPGTSGLAGLPPPYGSMTTDGLVMRNTAFGSIGTAVNGAPYNLGRTATHEVGHWVGLRHIWGDSNCGTDYCTDTPPAQAPNYNCPSHPYKLGVCNGNSTGEMFMNYMDYTNDACMYMFSNDQKTRAQLIMSNSPMRASLLTSTVCNLPAVSDEIGILFIGSPTYSQNINCNNYINPVVMVHNFGSNTITTATYSFNVDGVNTQTMAWSGSMLPNTSATITLPQISNLSNGPHQFFVGVYNPNGQPDPVPGNNNSNQPFTISNSFTMTPSGPAFICPGGSASLTVSGTAAGYTWMPGAIQGTIASVNPSVSTVYTITGGTGTCVNTATMLVSVGNTVVIAVNSASICSGLQVVLSASGAASYTWSTNQSNTPSITVTPTVTTSYTVSGYSNDGCFASTVTQVTVVAQPNLSVSVSPSGSLCPGGTATITASGASTYTWDNGSNGNAIVVSPTINTTYTLSAENQGCSAFGSQTVFVGSSSLNIVISPNPATLCAGSNLILTGTGANTYTWNGGSNSPSISVSPLADTGYTVNGTNGACSASAAITVSVLPNPTLVVSAAPALSVCAGDAMTLTAAGANTYLWDNGNTGASIQVTPTVSTIYTVTGNSNGCAVTETIGITVTGSTLQLVASSSSPSICAGGNIVLSASGISSYTWSTGASNTSVTVNPGTTTTYTLFGDDNGCTAEAYLTVSVVPSPTLALSVFPSTLLCPGQTATLAANGTYSVYTWSNPIVNSPSVAVSPQVNTNYTVSASGSPDGCTTSSVVALTMTTGPVSVLTSTNTYCEDFCSGVVNAMSSGGTAPYTYSLSNGTCSTLPCQNLCQGLYTLFTIDSLGCRSYNYFSIECNGLSTGLEDLNVLAGTDIYPNPASNELNIRVPAGKFSYTLYNYAGQLITKGQSDDNTAQLKLDAYARGLYLVIIESGNNQIHKKVLIE